MCGIFGCFENNCDNISVLMYEGLTSLQHRGQDSCGISTSKYSVKGKGLVRDVFTTEKLSSINDYCGIGHVRYATSGTSVKEDRTNMERKTIQPFIIDSDDNFPRISMCHNGNLKKINGNLIEENISDSWLIIDEFKSKLKELCLNDKSQINIDVIWSVIEYLYKILEGSYTLLFIIDGFGMIAIRDRYGIRPLSYGMNNSSYVVSSETCAINTVGYSVTRDIRPGESIFFEKGKMPVFRKTTMRTSLSPCLFEYIYFSRSDSVVDEINIYNARYSIGCLLGKHIDTLEWSKNIDIIVPVPDSSFPFALGVQSILNKPLHQGLIKNTYIERTFIMENEKLIQKNVKRKLNVNQSIVSGKNVLIVDDSIVRGNTSRHIVSLLKSSFAKNVYFSSGAPPILYPNHYGIYIPTNKELIASGRNISDVADIIGAKEVVYNDLSHILHCLKKINPLIENFETSMFESKDISFR
jgi:amidophosphoribosyltransferase